LAFTPNRALLLTIAMATAGQGQQRQQGKQWKGSKGKHSFII